MTKVATYVAMVLLLLTPVGCGNHKKKNRTPPGVVVGNLIIQLPAVSEENQKLILDAVEIHLDEFEKDFGETTAFAVAAVTTETTVDCGDTQNAIGCIRFPGGNITVISGQKFEVPAMYHELWHLNTPGGDVNHDHIDWPSRDLRGSQIANDIRLSRPFINLGPDTAD